MQGMLYHGDVRDAILSCHKWNRGMGGMIQCWRERDLNQRVTQLQWQVEVGVVCYVI